MAARAASIRLADVCPLTAYRRSRALCMLCALALTQREGCLAYCIGHTGTLKIFNAKSWLTGTRLVPLQAMPKLT